MAKWKPNNLEKIHMLFQDTNGINLFHDVVFEATLTSYTDDELLKIFKMLPESIQDVAFEWTLSDTDFREMALKFLNKTPINIRRSRESLIQR
jgi:hypothetical protein